MKKKATIAVTALLLVLCFTIGGTLAWLKTETTPIVNTFTYGDINITLTEEAGKDSDYEFKMIPGNDITKDPNVTVEANSEACWLFVEVEKTNNPDAYIEYAINSCWTALDGVDGGYYYNGTDLNQLLTADKTYSILTGDKVTVKDTVTKTDMTSIRTNYPMLTFTAYAVQKANVNDVADAWTIANNQGQLPTT